MDRDWYREYLARRLRRIYPGAVGAVRYPGIKLHDPRVIRLLEVLLHGGSHVGGWSAKQIHQTVISTFHLSDRRYGINQLRYDPRRIKGHGLLQRDGSRYAYRLSPKGVQVALLFLFFHKRLCGPLANSRFHHRPVARHQPHSRIGNRISPRRQSHSAYRRSACRLPSSGTIVRPFLSRIRLGRIYALSRTSPGK